MSFKNKNNSFSPLKRGDSWGILFTFWENFSEKLKLNFSKIISSKINLRDLKQNFIAEPDRISVNQIASNIFCNFDPTTTRNIESGKTYVLDVEITDSDGKVFSTKDLFLTVKIDRTIPSTTWANVFTSLGLQVRTVDGNEVRVRA